LQGVRWVREMGKVRIRAKMDMGEQPCAELGEISGIERLIKERLAAAVAAGFGHWVDSPVSALGRPIYHVTHGPVTLVLSESGLLYDGPALPFACRYAEIEHIELSTLGDLTLFPDESSSIEIVLGGVPEPLGMYLPLRIYTEVATVLDQIVQELA
jgi:hypothetical protein